MDHHNFVLFGAYCDIFRSDEKQSIFSFTLDFTVLDPLRGRIIYHSIGEVQSLKGKLPQWYGNR